MKESLICICVFIRVVSSSSRLKKVELLLDTYTVDGRYMRIESIVWNWRVIIRKVELSLQGLIVNKSNYICTLKNILQQKFWIIVDLKEKMEGETPN